MEIESLISQLEEIIPRLMQDSYVPGASIALIRNAECVWAKGFGIKNADTGEPVSSSTAFPSASCDKPLFAYAAAKMCELGTLDLDTPLDDYLDEPFVASEPRIKDITLRMVLSHTSGLAQSSNIVLDPGGPMSYSLCGINYLATVITHLSSTSISEFMRKHVLTPLDMRNSCFTESDQLPANVAVGHDDRGCPSEAIMRTTASALYTTAADYAKFMIEFMDPKHIDQDVAAEMLVPQVQLSGSLSWGLGWGLQHGSEGSSYWHWGGANVRNFALGFPEQKLGAVILTNSIYGDRIWAEVIGGAIGGNQPALSRLRWVKS